MKRTKKIISLWLILVLGLSLAACNKSKEDDNDGGKANMVKEDISGVSEEEVIQKEIRLNDYNEVEQFYIKSGSKIEEILKQCGIEYVSSENKSFIASTNDVYKKYEKEYKQLFTSSTDVDFESGEGLYSIEMSYEMHDELKPTLEDSFIKVMYEIYKTSDSNISEEKFIKALNELISIEGEGLTDKTESYYIYVSKSDSSYTLHMSYDLPLIIKQREVFTKEYATVADFENYFYNALPPSYIKKQIIYGEIQDSKFPYYQLDESNTTSKPAYTMSYQISNNDLFGERYGMTMTGFVHNNIISYYEDRFPFVIGDKMISDMEQFIDILSSMIGFDISKYMSAKQLLSEVQTFIIKDVVEYSSSINHNLPIPGSEFRASCDVFEESSYGFYYGGYDTCDRLYGRFYDTSISGQYSDRPFYDIDLFISQPVKAEGITHK